MARRIETARAAGKVSLAVLVSRLLGLVREQVLAAAFGAAVQMDAFLVAFRIPNMLRDLFAEGALSWAFIPTFTRVLKREGREEAWLLASLVLNGLVIGLSLAALVFLVFSDQFVYLIASGYAGNPAKFELTSNLLEILSPFLLLIALASVAVGMLNTFKYFFLPALAPAFFNVCLIAAGLLVVPRLEAKGEFGIYAIAGGALAGGLLQFLVQVPLLRRIGYRYRPSFNFAHPGVKRIARLIGPAIIGASAVQVNVMVNTHLASLFGGDGPVSWLNYAFRVIYLPIGLFGVAVGVVNLREVALFAEQEKWEELKNTVANSVKLIALLAMPSMVGLIVLGVPIIRVIFERGKFTSDDTLYTAYALIFYSLGLMAYSGIKIYVPTFYALDDTRTPVRVSVMAVLVNISVNVILVFFVLPERYAYAGLAFGTSVAVWLNIGLLAARFRSRLGPLREYKVGAALLKTLSAAALMGGVVHWLNGFMVGFWPGKGLARDIPVLSICLAVGVVVYFGICHLLRVEETNYVWQRLRRRINA